MKGPKDVENRGWNTDHRGPLLIHSGKTWDADACDWIARQYQGERSEVNKLLWMMTIKSMQAHFAIDDDARAHAGEFGGIVGRVNLDVITSDSKSPWGMPGQRHWCVSGGRELPFLPCLGTLKIFEVEVPDGYAEQELEVVK